MPSVGFLLVMSKPTFHRKGRALEERAHYVGLGLFVFCAAICAISFSIWLHKKDHALDMLPYHIYFSSSVSGLSVGSPVKYKGITVGTVTDIDIAPHNPDTIRVLASIKHTTPIREGSVASLELLGITGEVYIQLTGVKKERPPLLPPQGEKIPVITSKDSSFDKIVHGMPELVSEANELIKRANHFLSDENQQKFSHTLDNLDSITGSVAKKKEDLSLLISEGAALATSLKQDVHAIKEATLSFEEEATALLKNTRPQIETFAETGLYDLSKTLSKIPDTLERFDNFMRNIEGLFTDLLSGQNHRGYKLDA